jgi:hypothetical protein
MVNLNHGQAGLGIFPPDLALGEALQWPLLPLLQYQRSWAPFNFNCSIQIDAPQIDNPGDPTYQPALHAALGVSFDCLTACDFHNNQGSPYDLDLTPIPPGGQGQGYTGEAFRYLGASTGDGTAVGNASSTYMTITPTIFVLLDYVLFDFREPSSFYGFPDGTPLASLFDVTAYEVGPWESNAFAFGGRFACGTDGVIYGPPPIATSFGPHPVTTITAFSGISRPSF